MSKKNKKKKKEISKLASFLLTLWSIFFWAGFLAFIGYIIVNEMKQPIQIERFSPNYPEAGKQLSLYGKNFPKRIENLEIYFSGLRVESPTIYADNRIDVTIPTNAISGILTIKNNSYHGLNWQSWVDINPKPHSLVAKTEGVSFDANSVKIKMNLMNQSSATPIEVTDIILQPLFSPPGIAAYSSSFEPSINLDIKVIFPDVPPLIGDFYHSSRTYEINNLFSKPRLLIIQQDQPIPVILSFENPESNASSFYLVFSVVFVYKDNDEEASLIFADKIFRIMTNDNYIFYAESLEMNEQTISSLENEYNALIKPLPIIK